MDNKTKGQTPSANAVVYQQVAVGHKMVFGTTRLGMTHLIAPSDEVVLDDAVIVFDLMGEIGACKRLMGKRLK